MKKEPIVLTMLISMKSIDLEAFLIGQLMYYQEAFGWVALGQVYYWVALKQEQLGAAALSWTGLFMT